MRNTSSKEKPLGHGKIYKRTNGSGANMAGLSGLPVLPDFPVLLLLQASKFFIDKGFQRSE